MVLPKVWGGVPIKSGQRSYNLSPDLSSYFHTIPAKQKNGRPGLGERNRIMNKLL